MTQDNFDRLIQNLTFAYIQELSRSNVTRAEVTGDVPAGTYAIWVVALETGNVTIEDPIVSYPPINHDSSIPWDVLAIVIGTAIVSILATYAVMRFKNRGND